MIEIVDSINTRRNRVEVFLQDNDKNLIIQVDVRVMPNGRVLIEAELLTGPDPLENGISFTVEDEGKSAYLKIPSPQDYCTHPNAKSSGPNGTVMTCPDCGKRWND